MTGVWLLMTITSALAGGWRGDGTAIASGATPPLSWSATSNICWSVPLAGPGNASPILLSDRVCLTTEPTTLQCHALSDGRLLWSASNDYADTLDPTARAAHLAEATRIAATEQRLTADNAEFSRLQREVRRDPASAATALLPELSARIEAARAEVDAFDRYRTVRPRSIIGYATETPVTDGNTLWAQFGNGVISRFEADGTRAWSRWLGEAPRSMRGFDTGTSSSPLLIDGVLITTFGFVRGLDPRTGATLWTGPPYADYGTPAALWVAGEGYVALPDGQVLRAETGRMVSRNLGDLWFTGPHGLGDRVWYAGGHSNQDVLRSGGIRAQSWKLTPTPAGGLQPTARWAAQVPSADTFYTSPVVHAGLVYLLTDQGQLTVIDDTSGQIVYQALVRPSRDAGIAYPSPTIAGGNLYLSFDKGWTVVAETGSTWRPLATNQLEPFRTTPAFQGGRIYVRGESHLWCVGP